MQDFDTTLGEDQTDSAEREGAKQRVWDFLVYLFKRFVLFVSFGTGVLGFLWLLGRIFRR
jgi:hypothetical protein